MRYLWYYNIKALSHNECVDLVTDITNGDTTQFTDLPADGKHVNTTVVTSESVGDKLKHVYELVYEANEDIFGFDLFAKPPRYINLNTYSASHSHEYPYHRDATPIGSTSDVKLTAVINVSDSLYVGGEFEFFDGKDVRINEIDIIGSMIVFPSFMYHRVKPVTQGTRKTISLWFTGRNYR